MKLLDLARTLNCTELIVVQNELKETCRKQQFKYVLIIDFEATCWERNDNNRGYTEIIEFPCVLYNVEEASIVTYFHQYVMPTEYPKLSRFCNNLTGITQHQVDNGVPIKICMMLFKSWLESIKSKYGISFETTAPISNRCIFATWSDWDLGNCLKNECRRKQINLPEIFSRWIDVRALYRMHYMRKPKGLLGALFEVGLEFEGREHCGLHDANNTAKLLGRMVAEGVVLKCTNDHLNK